MANINGFRASLTNGLVRPNQFRVDLNFPTTSCRTALTLLPSVASM
jgi:hypothetical protein